MPILQIYELARTFRCGRWELRSTLSARDRVRNPEIYGFG